MNSTIALLVNIPMLLLLYIMIYFTQSLSGKRQFYGISLNSDYFTKIEFRSLDKKFKLLVTIGFAIFLVFTIISIYIYNAYVFASLVPILGFCLYQFIVYVYIHNKVKLLKEELSINSPDVELVKTNVLLDTEFINEKNRIVKKYSILFLIPLVMLSLVGIYIVIKYDSIPDIIPTHWGFSGAADAFGEKSFIKIVSQVAMMVGLGFVIYISSIGSLKSRLKLTVNNVNESKKQNLYYLNKYALSFFVLNLTCQIMFMVILIATFSGSDINTLVMWPCTILIIFASLYSTYLYYKSPTKSKDAVYSVDDNDDLWILGSLYNNPNDPSLFVQKRFGVGWTINVGTTKGKILFILPFLIILLSLAFI